MSDGEMLLKSVGNNLHFPFLVFPLCRRTFGMQVCAQASPSPQPRAGQGGGSHGCPLASVGAEMDKGWKTEGFSPRGVGKARLVRICSLRFVVRHHPAAEGTAALKDLPKVTENLGRRSPRCNALCEP